MSFEFLDSTDEKRVSGKGASVRRPDMHLGAIEITEDFDEPLPDEFWFGTTCEFSTLDIRSSDAL